MFIIVYGNPVDGFDSVGPFKSFDDAAEWAYVWLSSVEWRISPIAPHN